MTRLRSEQCYYCGSAATSREHAPPKLMFRGFSCDSITVPSCENHNTSKGGNDQAVVSAFLIPLQNKVDADPTKTKDLEPNIKKALDIIKSSFDRVKRKAFSSPLLHDPPPEFDDLPDVSYVTPQTDIRDWTRQLTAALVYDGTQSFDDTIKWNEAIAWSPDFLEKDDPTQIPLDQAESIILKKTEISTWLDTLDWHAGWSSYPRAYPPEIYFFELHFEDDEVIFKHRFYAQYSWYVRFRTSHDTLSNLKRKIGLSAR